MLFLTFKIPRSKRWLLMKGHREEAKKSMQFIYKGDVEDEFDQMAMTIGQLCCRPRDVDDTTTTDDDDSVYSNADGDPKVKRLRKSATAIDVKPSLFSAEYRPIMLIGVGLLAFQQFSGQPSVLAYSRVLFDAAGWEGHASVVTVVIMGVTSSLTVALVDRVGRKKLLAAGCIIMTAALLVLAFGFWGWDEKKDADLSDLKKQAILWSMFVYIAGYQVGFGPITWTVLSEIYPSEIRGTAMAFSVEVNFLSKFLCQLLFPIVQDLLGWGCTFLLFVCFVVLSLLFVIIKVPETKGLSLEEIQVKLRGLQAARGGPERKITRIGSYNSDGSGKRTMESPLLAISTQHRGLNPIV
jgi:MFS family permease